MTAFFSFIWKCIYEIASAVSGRGLDTKASLNYFAIGSFGLFIPGLIVHIVDLFKLRDVIVPRWKNICLNLLLLVGMIFVYFLIVYVLFYDAILSDLVL